MKARKKPMETLQSSDLGLTVTPNVVTISVETPSQRKSGKIVESVDELIANLKADGILA
jgi:electron transfer flavoprotein beta subunit